MMNVPGLLRRYGLRPKKSLGQNFLVDPAGLDKLLAAASLTRSSAVLEIGAGLGNLTRRLAEVAGRVVAVEIDHRLIPPLQEVLAPYGNVALVEGDILDMDPGYLMAGGDYQVVANIPYYITSALIRHLLDRETRPDRLVLTVQREVARRICAGPGEASLLSLSVQVYGAPGIVARIPAGMFYPRPKVDSSVVRVDVYPDPLIPAADLDLFFLLAKAGFSQRRKTLCNALSAGLQEPKDSLAGILEGAGIDSGRRAETLSLEEWGRLTAAYADQV